MADQGGIRTLRLEFPDPLPAGGLRASRGCLPGEQLVRREAGDVVLGAVLATHMLALHVHGEHVADLLDPVGLEVAADEAGAVQAGVILRIGQELEDFGRRVVDHALDGDVRGFAHDSTVPAAAASRIRSRGCGQNRAAADTAAGAGGGVAWPGGAG